MRVSTISLVVAAASILYAGDATLVEQIVAKVNGDIVTKTELERSLKQMEAETRQRAQGATQAQINAAITERTKDVLRDRMDQLLLVQKGKELNINVDPEVAKYLAQIQSENKIADPEKFQQWVRENTQMSYEDFRNEVKNGLVTQRVVGQEVGSKINIPKQEIQDYYDKNKASFQREERVFLREILISTEGKDAAGAAAADKKAKDIAARARKGEKFGDLVRDYSDAQTAKTGGDLGGWKKGELSPEIESQIWDKPKGYVTDPIKVPAGYLILRVDEHHKAGQATVEEVENEIKEKLYMTAFNPKVREYLTHLREVAFIEIRDGYVDSGAAPGKDTRWNDPALLKPETITKSEVEQQKRKKRFLGVPIPGTTATGKSSSK